MADNYYPLTTSAFHHEINVFDKVADVDRLFRWEYMTIQVVDSVDCVSVTISWLFEDSNWAEDAKSILRHSRGASGQVSDGYTELIGHRIVDDPMAKHSIRYRRFLLRMVRSLLHRMAPKAVALLNQGNQKPQTAEEWEWKWGRKWTIADFAEEQWRLG